jgi:hypothetical protein
LRRTFSRASARLRTLLLFFAATASALGAEPVEESVDEPSPWDWSATLRGGLGYKDNILLSDFFKESSIFTITDAEAFLFRVPTDGWEFTGVFTAEDRRYWQSDSVNKEQLFLVSSDVKKALGDDWKVGLAAQYFYNDQVFDASVSEGLPLRIRAKLHRASAGPSVQYDLGNGGRLEGSFTVGRMNFGQPLDDSWEIGPKILYAQKFGERGSEFTTMIQWRHRSYDTREAPGEPGKSLNFDIPELELGIRHHWDAAKHWRSRARIGVELNEDNGSGFYDYRRWKFSKDLSFTQGGFEGMLQAKVLHYDYAEQTIPPENKPRQRTELVLGARARQKIMKRLNAFMEVEHERVLATDIEERYHATTVWGGIEWELK